MRRLAATVRQDVQVQARNGFYAAAAFVLLSWGAILSLLPAGQLGRLLPSLLLSNCMIGTFYFVGGLTLLERAEGSLLARAVTPLRPAEYLLAHVISLGLLAVLENGALALLFAGGQVRALALAGGIGLAAAIYTLAGFIAVVRYDSINAYLLPSVGVAGLLTIPVLGALGGWAPWPIYLHPLQPALVLLEGGFRPLAAWEAGYAIAAGAAWCGLLLAWAARSFRRTVAGM